MSHSSHKGSTVFFFIAVNKVKREILTIFDFVLLRFG